MSRKRRDLSRTARCLDCGQWNEYDSLGTLVIRHKSDCPSVRESSDRIGFDICGEAFQDIHSEWRTCTWPEGHKSHHLSDPDVMREWLMTRGLP